MVPKTIAQRKMLYYSSCSWGTEACCPQGMARIIRCTFWEGTKRNAQGAAPSAIPLESEASVSVASGGQQGVVAAQSAALEAPPLTCRLLRLR